MSRPASPEAVKLIASVLSADRDVMAGALGMLADRFSPFDFVSEYLPFEYTDYYREEMGEGLFRRFVSFEELVPPDDLPAIKHSTNDMETRFGERGRRRVNIDPGYLSRSQLVLATGKPYAHRPYLRDGIYADVTLLFRNRSFQALEWTYPDYAAAPARRLFTMLRERYLLQRATDKGKAGNDG